MRIIKIYKKASKQRVHTKIGDLVPHEPIGNDLTVIEIMYCNQVTRMKGDKCHGGATRAYDTKSE